jgi:hypothetical protein|tara:strand:+ start:477 stop:644 length:168 start_codon:yes stop_codon:yes gene_type:complete
LTDKIETDKIKSLEKRIEDLELENERLKWERDEEINTRRLFLYWFRKAKREGWRL